MRNHLQCQRGPANDRSMVMVMMMTAAVLTVPEDQRFDDHWDGFGIGQFLPDIYKIEILKIDAVD